MKKDDTVVLQHTGLVQENLSASFEYLSFFGKYGTLRAQQKKSVFSRL